MSRQSTIIRDAVFNRVKVLTPAGHSAWGAATVTAYPSLNTTMLPALQVSVARPGEVMTPDGQAGMGFPHFVAEATIGISVLRGLDDPMVLDGQADTDFDLILETLLNDPEFVSPNKFFRGVTRVVYDKQPFQQAAESYLLELLLRITFDYQIGFGPVPTVPLQDVAVAIGGYNQPLPGN